MKVLLASAFILFSCVGLTAQPPAWRFGFEYNEYEPPFFGVSEASHDTLLTRLSNVTSSQMFRGGINVNWGGWAQMQANENAPVNFSVPDSWVKRFQKFGFELVFNLVSTAQWAFAANPHCIHPGGTTVLECAPDEAHWQHWRNYVKAVVERYDGDGVNDMPGLLVPVRYYVMVQEVYFAGDGGGDASEASGQGFWEDNMYNLVRLHRETYDAMKEADPGGQTKLVGSGGLLFDLYSDFPDYPDVEGPAVKARLAGDNLYGSKYQAGFDSLVWLLSRLGDDTDDIKCDYIGWHPHLGWKASDQCLRLVRKYAPTKPIFIDDMWSAMLLGIPPFQQPGYTHFIGGDSIEGDFPTASITSYNELLSGLTNGNQQVTDWYNAKNAREAAKCFATVFGGGAERICYSMSNDLNSSHPLFGIGYPWRYSGMVRSVQANYARKPVSYTMQLLIDKLHDFTAVEQVYPGVIDDPLTRVYRFKRQRGTDCYVAWSESGGFTPTPEVPNGATVQFPVLSQTLLLTHLVTQPGVTQPAQESLSAGGGMVNIQLGFQPVIIEEQMASPVSEAPAMPPVQVFPNPASGYCMVKQEGSACPMQSVVSFFDVFGKCHARQTGNIEAGIRFEWKQLSPGTYWIRVETACLGSFWKKLVVGR